MDVVPQRELCVTAIYQIATIGFNRASQYGAVIGFTFRRGTGDVHAADRASKDLNWTESAHC